MTIEYGGMSYSVWLPSRLTVWQGIAIGGSVHHAADCVVSAHILGRHDLLLLVFKEGCVFGAEMWRYAENGIALTPFLGGLEKEYGVSVCL